MIDLCECKKSEWYSCERENKKTACDWYEKKGRHYESKRTDKTGNSRSQKRRK